MLAYRRDRFASQSFSVGSLPICIPAMVFIWVFPAFENCIRCFVAKIYPYTFNCLCPLAGRAFPFCLETERKQRIQGCIKILKNFLQKLKELKLAQPHIPSQRSNSQFFLNAFQGNFLNGILMRPSIQEIRQQCKWVKYINLPNCLGMDYDDELELFIESPVAFSHLSIRNI